MLQGACLICVEVGSLVPDGLGHEGGRDDHDEQLGPSDDGWQVVAGDQAGGQRYTLHCSPGTPVELPDSMGTILPLIDVEISMDSFFSEPISKMIQMNLSSACFQNKHLSVAVWLINQWNHGRP